MCSNCRRLIKSCQRVTNSSPTSRQSITAFSTTSLPSFSQLSHWFKDCSNLEWLLRTRINPRWIACNRSLNVVLPSNSSAICISTFLDRANKLPTFSHSSADSKPNRPSSFWMVSILPCIIWSRSTYRFNSSSFLITPPNPSITDLSSPNSCSSNKIFVLTGTSGADIFSVIAVWISSICWEILCQWSCNSEWNFLWIISSATGIICIDFSKAFADSTLTLLLTSCCAFNSQNCLMWPGIGISEFGNFSSVSKSCSAIFNQHSNLSVKRL